MCIPLSGALLCGAEKLWQQARGPILLQVCLCYIKCGCSLRWQACLSWTLSTRQGHWWSLLECHLLESNLLALSCVRVPPQTAEPPPVGSGHRGARPEQLADFCAAPVTLSVLKRRIRCFG